MLTSIIQIFAIWTLASMANKASLLKNGNTCIYGVSCFNQRVQVLEAKRKKATYGNMRVAVTRQHTIITYHNQLSFIHLCCIINYLSDRSEGRKKSPSTVSSLCFVMLFSIKQTLTSIVLMGNKASPTWSRSAFKDRCPKCSLESNGENTGGGQAFVDKDTTGNMWQQRY